MPASRPIADSGRPCSVALLRWLGEGLRRTAEGPVSSPTVSPGEVTAVQTLGFRASDRIGDPKARFAKPVLVFEISGFYGGLRQNRRYPRAPSVA